MDFDNDYVPDLLTDQAGQLAEYDQRTFKAKARIFHKDAWTDKVPRDRANVTLPALVKEFNAAFNNKEAQKRIEKEYEAARSKYINEILDAEDLRAYPDPKTCRATKLPCIPNNFFRFFQLFQKYDLDQKHREKMLDREREQVRREMAEMRKALWVYRKHRATNESYEDLQKRADDEFRFYIVSDPDSSDEDQDEDIDEDIDEDSDEDSDEESKKRKTSNGSSKTPAKKQKTIQEQSDGSGSGGGSSRSSSNKIDLVGSGILSSQNKNGARRMIRKDLLMNTYSFSFLPSTVFLCFVFCVVYIFFCCVVYIFLLCYALTNNECLSWNGWWLKNAFTVIFVRHLKGS